MKYFGESDYRHGQARDAGVLLTNLGTPDEPTAPALRRYLKQFLWDPRVVEVPRPMRHLAPWLGDPDNSPEQRAAARERALALGAEN
ncbi:ferrochelatase [Thioalkalivibrio sp. ALE20]|uniref:ferrochelatase n=1 Tax=Thioalkalivibrio sp. ALE20 TaxID=545275 RepID=UPI00037D9C70